MSLSKAFYELDPAEQFVFATTFKSPEVQVVMDKLKGWSKEQLSTLDPDSEDFKAEYRRIAAVVAVISEIYHLSKQEKHDESTLTTDGV